MKVYLLKQHFGGGDHDLEGVYTTREKAEEASRVLVELSKVDDQMRDVLNLEIEEVELDVPLIRHGEFTGPAPA